MGVNSNNAISLNPVQIIVQYFAGLRGQTVLTWLPALALYQIWVMAQVVPICSLGTHLISTLFLPFFQSNKRKGIIPQEHRSVQGTSSVSLLSIQHCMIWGGKKNQKLLHMANPLPVINTLILSYLCLSMVVLYWAPQCCFNQSLGQLWVMCGSTQIALSLSHASYNRGKTGEDEHQLESSLS